MLREENYSGIPYMYIRAMNFIDQSQSDFSNKYNYQYLHQLQVLSRAKPKDATSSATSSHSDSICIHNVISKHLKRE